MAEAKRRAHEGFEEPIFYQGKQVGAIRKWSDNLLMFLIKARRPEYRERFEAKIESKTINVITGVDAPIAGLVAPENYGLSKEGASQAWERRALPAGDPPVVIDTVATSSVEEPAEKPTEDSEKADPPGSFRLVRPWENERQRVAKM